MFGVAAGEPVLAVRGDVRPGADIEVVGRRFGNRETVDLTWDGIAVSWLPATPTDREGRFVLSTGLPTSVAPGAHELAAVQRLDADEQSEEPRRASIIVDVFAGVAVVAGAPTAEPTGATPESSGSATPVPGAPTPEPSGASTPVSTAAPTSGPPAGTSPLAVVGYGAGTTGGSGGKVYSVATWAELKAALLASGPRIVRLVGSANLDGGGEHLKIKNGNLTIDGSGWSGSLRRYSIVIAASNVIVTQLRLRPGDQIARPADGDGLAINPGSGSSLSRVVIDHSSLLWAADVTLSILNNVSDVTVQYSILGVGLYYSSHPEVSAGHGHSMGPNVTTVGSNPNPGSEYGRRITFYRNYIVHNNARNIRAEGTDAIEYVNNVVYNWGTDLAHMNPRGANVVGNMFKRGPDTPNDSRVVRSDTDDSYPKIFANSVYWADNLGLGFTPTLAFSAGAQRSSLYGGSLHGVTAKPATSALAAGVVAGAGPSLVDSIDQRLKDDFSSGGGRFYNGAGYPAPNPSW